MAHASDLFQALVDYSVDDTKGEMFLRFVWLRCHHKIKHRLRADEAMLGISLPDLLDHWTVAPSDVVEQQWFTVTPTFHDTLNSGLVPSRPLEGTENREFDFSFNTIPVWCDLFADVLREAKSLAADCDTQ